MHHSFPFYRSGSHANFRYSYLENHSHTMYFVENYNLYYCEAEMLHNKMKHISFFQMIHYHFNSE